MAKKLLVLQGVTHKYIRSSYTKTSNDKFERSQMVKHNTIGLHPNINKEQNLIVGQVIYIDNYGNVVSNISKSLFKEIGGDRPFEIRAGRFKTRKLFTHYSDVVNYSIPKENRQFDGSDIALFNTSNFLEIALYRSDLISVGGASTLLGLEENSPVSISFNTP